MPQDKSEFVEFDGVLLHIDVIKKMAKNCGNYSTAEHYMVAILTHALFYQMDEYIDVINEIRQWYNVPPVTKRFTNPASGKNMPQTGGLQQDMDALARKIYKAMSRDEQFGLLKDGMLLLRSQQEDLFYNKSCWMGIVLVVNARLDPHLKMSQLYDFALNVTPDDWPDNLTATKIISTNYSKNVDAKDRQQPYYCMENNPWQQLCDTYWEIVKQLLLQENIRREN